MVRPVEVRSPSLASAAQGPTYPFEAATSRVFSLHGHPFSRAHFSTSRWPPFAAAAHVVEFHGQPFSRAHCSASRWPRHAAFLHVRSSHGQPFSRAHCSASSWPPCAAAQHVSSSHGQPFSRAHCSTWRWPPTLRNGRCTSCPGDPAEEDSEALSSIQAARQESVLACSLSTHPRRRASNGSPLEDEHGQLILAGRPVRGSQS